MGNNACLPTKFIVEMDTFAMMGTFAEWNKDTVSLMDIQTAEMGQRVHRDGNAKNKEFLLFANERFFK